MRYARIVDGQYVFSDNPNVPEKSLYYIDHWVSNPTPEMIAEMGWVEFIPPVVPASPQDEPDYDEVLAAVKQMLSSDVSELSDEDALDVAALYPTWSSKLPKDGEQEGQPVVAGDRLWDDGKLWKVLQPHNVMPNWRPADTPALFVEVSFVEWPEWVQPLGAHDAYELGAHVSHNGSHWESTIAANVNEPGVYGWRQVD